MTGVWRKLHNEYLHNLCAPQNIICVIQSQKLSEMVRTDKWEVSEIRMVPLSQRFRRCVPTVPRDISKYCFFF